MKKPTTMTNKRLIIEMMLTYDVDFAVKCLMLLYERQTLDEQVIEQSVHQNQQGFNSTDAPILSNYAESIRHEKGLTVAEQSDLGLRIHKYAKQLVPLIKDEELIS